MQDQSKLFAKMAAVMGSVRTLEKTGENKFDRYTFVTADAVAHRLGEVMAANGVAFFPSLISLETTEFTVKSGAINYRTVANFQLTFACTETGATFTTLWSGEAIDRSDKSISKAATSAIKYALIKTFLLSGGDEEDADAESPVVVARQATPRSQSSTRTAPKPAASQDASAEVLEGIDTYSAGADELFTPAPHADAPATPAGRIKPKTVSQAQLSRIEALAQEAYGPALDAVKLAEFASKGVVNQFAMLLPHEGEKLIKALEKRIKDNAQEAAPAPAVNGKVAA